MDARSALVTPLKRTSDRASFTSPGCAFGGLPPHRPARLSRPGPPMAPPATKEDKERDAGLFLLVDAAENNNSAVRGTALNWIHSLQSSQWENVEYSQFLEAMIATYRSNVSAKTRTEIARMLAMNPCRRVDRFMEAARHSSVPEVRTTASKYFSPRRPART